MNALMSSSDLRIDSHQHFWLRERGDYTWLTPDLGEIFTDFLPEHLQPILQKHSMQKTVLVQAAESDGETDYLLWLAQEHDFIAAVVGWVNFESEYASIRLATLAENNYLKGIRPMIQGIKDDDWMLSPEFSVIYQQLSDLGLSFDALIKPQHLNALGLLARRHSRLKIVIDHAAKPDLESTDLSEWKADMSEVAKNKNVYCKVSGLLTEAPADSSFETFRPVLDHLFESFGAARLMWGSDWPVLNLAGTYDTWIQSCEAYFSQLAPQDRARVWAGSAQEFYGL